MEGKVRAISLVWIVVKNLDEAIHYYTETVGLKLTEHNPEFGWAELSASDGGAALGLAQTSEHEELPPGSNGVITLSVDDIIKAKANMAVKGMKFIGDIVEIAGVVKLQTFVDSDGNRFQLAEMP